MLVMSASTTHAFFEVTGYNVSSTSNMSVSRLEISISCFLQDTPLPMCGEISATIRIVINICTGQNIFCPETASIHAYDPECVVTDKAFNTTVQRNAFPEGLHQQGHAPRHLKVQLYEDPALGEHNVIRDPQRAKE